MLGGKVALSHGLGDSYPTGVPVGGARRVGHAYVTDPAPVERNLRDTALIRWLFSQQQMGPVTAFVFEQGIGDPRLGVISGSVRDVRVGHIVARWVADKAQSHGGFEVDLIDLAEVALMLTTGVPHHPRLVQYLGEAPRAWSERIAACDAFVIVTPECDDSAPAGLKNALELIYTEWNCKPVGFVSYGGISGGLCAVQPLKGPCWPCAWCRWPRRGWLRWSSAGSRTGCSPATPSRRPGPRRCGPRCAGAPARRRCCTPFPPDTASSGTAADYPGPIGAGAPITAFTTPTRPGCVHHIRRTRWASKTISKPRPSSCSARR